MNLENLIRRIIKEEKQKLRESGYDDNTEHLATNLLDYLEGDVPDLPNWRADPNVVRFFRTSGITDNTEAAKIYQKAIESSSDNKPRSKNTDRRYLNN